MLPHQVGMYLHTGECILPGSSLSEEIGNWHRNGVVCEAPMSSMEQYLVDQTTFWKGRRDWVPCCKIVHRQPPQRHSARDLRYDFLATAGGKWEPSLLAPSQIPRFRRHATKEPRCVGPATSSFDEVLPFAELWRPRCTALFSAHEDW